MSKMEKRTGMVFSDSKIDHGYFLDVNEADKGWESYTVTAKPNFKNSGIKKVTLKIDKKKKCVTSVKIAYKKYTANYYVTHPSGCVTFFIENIRPICYN